MKLPIALLLALMFFLPWVSAVPRAAEAPATTSTPASSVSNFHPSPAPVAEGRLRSKKKGKLRRWWKKLRKNLAASLQASTALKISLGLVGLTILLFALSSEVAFLSIVASVAAIAAAGFFVFWVVKAAGRRSPIPDGSD